MISVSFQPLENQAIAEESERRNRRGQRISHVRFSSSQNESRRILDFGPFRRSAITFGFLSRVGDKPKNDESLNQGEKRRGRIVVGSSMERIDR